MKYCQVFLGIALFIPFACSQRKIYSGVPADLEKFGHVVLLKIFGNTCTGCIIHQDWILTAAHCVCRQKSNEPVLARSVTITAGMVNLRDMKDAQVRKGRKIIVHEEYRQILAKPDLAVILVNQTFEFIGPVKKMEFFTSGWPQNSKGLWEDCVAAGWGRTEEGSANTLNVYETSAKHGINSCPCIVKFYHLKRLVCLATKEEGGICFGDSGGALLCDGKIVGVAHAISDSRSCKYTDSPDNTINCDSVHVYGLYIYTCPYLSWISQHVPGVPQTPDSCLGIQFTSPIFGNYTFFILYFIFSLLEQCN